MTFFPYETVSEFFEVEGDFVENQDDSAEHDAVRSQWEDERYAEWEAEHAEDIAEGEYLEWAMMRDEDGMDSSREAYDAHIDALVYQQEQNAEDPW